MSSRISFVNTAHNITQYGKLSLQPMTKTDEQHSGDVKILQAKVRDFYAQQKKFRIYHGTTNSTRSVKFEKDKFIDISKLDRVISVNTDRRYTLVEPNVPMDKLIEETRRHGLVPPVVPEFPGITIGGAIQGGAEESSSFKYGMVHDCCTEYEVILGNGELLTVSPQENADLFNGIAASYGSVGIITLVKLRLIPTKDFVKLNYHTIRSFDEATNLIKQKTNEQIDFVDAVMFSRDFGVVMSGTFSAKNNLPTSTFSKASDDWFYLHAEKIAKKHESYTELIPLKDYLFRYDRGAFWMGYYDFKVTKIPFNRFTRFIFNSIFSTRSLFRIIHETNFSQKYFIQDFNIPSKNTLEFLNIADKKLGIYPLWICPLKPGKEDFLSANYIETDLVFNIGIWGESNIDFQEFVKINKEFENMSGKLGGRKMLYAHQYYSLDEFWKVYDQKHYNELRTKYHANETLPTIYEKTLVTEKYKPSIPRGIWNYLKSPFKVRIS